MKILRNKCIMIIITIFLIVTFASGISIYATYKYLSKDVSYLKADGKEISVEDALNELYNISNANIEYITFDSNGHIRTPSGTFYTKTISIPKGKKMVYIYSSVSSTYSCNNPTINSNIINMQNTRLIKDITISGQIANLSFLTTIETNGENGDITINYNCGGTGTHFVQAIVFYK